MTVPKKPLTKNESAIQLGNVLKYASRGGSTKAGILNKIKKLLIKPKSTKSSSKVTEVQTRPKKSLQNQKTPKIKYGSSSIETTESLQGLTKKHGEKLSPLRKAYLTKKHPKADMESLKYKTKFYKKHGKKLVIGNKKSLFDNPVNNPKP